MISDTITKQITDALKAHDEIRLSTLRLLSSALNYEKIAKQHDLDEEEEMVVVRHEAKMRKDAIEAYEKAGSKERAEKEKLELKILEEYLPTQMDDANVEKLVDEAIAQTGAKTMADMGKVIGIVMGKSNGQIEGSRVSEIAKRKLSGQ